MKKVHHSKPNTTTPTGQNRHSHSKRLKVIALAVLTVFLGSMLIAPVQALSPEQRKLYDDTVLYFNHEDDVLPICAPGEAVAGGAGSIPVRGSDNIGKAYNYFVDRGLTPQQSAGIVGNLIAESGVDPTQKQNGGGLGRGIAQWEVGSRWDTIPPVKGQPANVKDFAASPTGNGRPLIDLGLQLDFLWHELNTTESKALRSLRGATTVGQAAVAFLIDFERPKDKRPDGPNARKRTEEAAGVLLKYGGGAPVGGTAATPGVDSACGGAGLGGIGVGKITFPLITTKSAIRNNKPSRWCFQNETNCHHDYNAADIMIGEGTTVIAAVGGTVGLTSSNPGSSASLTIIGDDKNVYFYQHMAPGSLLVARGQKVAAATQIGKVGNRAAAFGTDTHLHFDMQPPPATSRPPCKGPACKAYTFLIVQPLLIEAFNGLPE